MFHLIITAAYSSSSRKHRRLHHCSFLSGENSFRKPAPNLASTEESEGTFCRMRPLSWDVRWRCFSADTISVAFLFKRPRSPCGFYTNDGPDEKKWLSPRYLKVINGGSVSASLALWCISSWHQEEETNHQTLTISLTVICSGFQIILLQTLLWLRTWPAKSCTCTGGHLFRFTRGTVRVRRAGGWRGLVKTVWEELCFCDWWLGSINSVFAFLSVTH